MARWNLGKRIAPPRFVAFVAIMVIASAITAGPLSFAWGRALMTGFDIAALVFLASLWPLLDDDVADLRQRAKDNDANRAGLLALTALVTAVILVAIGNELSGKPSPLTVALVIATLAMAWLFSNTVYALHYAHLYYSDDAHGGDVGGLDVPGTGRPDYADFIYFAFTLGMTFQTSDVQMTGRAMRRVAIGHCLAAFVFNLGVLAFTINVLGGG